MIGKRDFLTWSRDGVGIRVWLPALRDQLTYLEGAFRQKSMATEADLLAETLLELDAVESETSRLMKMDQS